MFTVHDRLGVDEHQHLRTGRSLAAAADLACVAVDGGRQCVSLQPVVSFQRIGGPALQRIVSGQGVGAAAQLALQPGARLGVEAATQVPHTFLVDPPVRPARVLLALQPGHRVVLAQATHERGQPAAELGLGEHGGLRPDLVAVPGQAHPIVGRHSGQRVGHHIHVFGGGVALGQCLVQLWDRFTRVRPPLRL